MKCQRCKKPMRITKSRSSKTLTFFCINCCAIFFKSLMLEISNEGSNIFINSFLNKKIKSMA